MTGLGECHLGRIKECRQKTTSFSFKSFKTWSAGISGLTLKPNWRNGFYTSPIPAFQLPYSMRNSCNPIPVCILQLSHDSYHPKLHSFFSQAPSRAQHMSSLLQITSDLPATVHEPRPRLPRPKKEEKGKSRRSKMISRRKGQSLRRPAGHHKWGNVMQIWKRKILMTRVWEIYQRISKDAMHL
ncbi:hypothetical protein L873DRAFT_676039 [Choiromyces venosus 120613-1]|uniref:Uncharacterized protein n=1 Tax=Choiromyces venosus 120613-1 TaxID=1336337 RepID=A0A3N4JSK7_9PEZI|nr:hypothetical protein L873DRAFT_676039 [Choiromyces venosus 120613-1]